MNENLCSFYCEPQRRLDRMIQVICSKRFWTNVSKLAGESMIRKGAKRKVSARDPIFGGSCVPEPLPLEDSNITGVPQAA